MEIDNGDPVSSDEEMQSDVVRTHTAELRIDVGSEEFAQIVCRTLSVDKEPSRSSAVRSISVSGVHVVIKVESADRRSLQKSVANLLDMCELAKSAIDLVEKKSWIDTRPVAKKPKLVK